VQTALVGKLGPVLVCQVLQTFCGACLKCVPMAMPSTTLQPVAAPRPTANQPAVTMPADIQELGNQIRALKASLKTSGMKGKDIKNHPQVASMVAELERRKAASGIDPKTNLPYGVPGTQPKAIEPQVVQQTPEKRLPPDLQHLGNQLHAMKTSLKAQGIIGQRLKEHPQVAALSEHINQAMKVRVGGVSNACAPGPSCAPKSSPSKKPLPPHVQAQCDYLEKVKAGLRSTGLNGKQLELHPQVAAMSAQLDQMKIQAGLKQAPQPPLPPHIQSFKDQIKAVKDNLKSQGWKGPQLEHHPQLAAMKAQLNQMKVQAGFKVTASSPPLPSHIQAFSDQLGKLKSDLKAMGIKGDQLTSHPQVANMTAQLDQMKVQAGLKAPPKPSQPLPPHIEAIRSQLKALKQQLKASGLPERQVNQHPQVSGVKLQLDQALVAAGLKGASNGIGTDIIHTTTKVAPVSAQIQTSPPQGYLAPSSIKTVASPLAFTQIASCASTVQVPTAQCRPSSVIVHAAGTCTGSNYQPISAAPPAPYPSTAGFPARSVAQAPNMVRIIQ